MAKRLFLRTGEVPVLYGLDNNKSEWALWSSLTDGEDSGAGDYGKWQARLMSQIMAGICEDHDLKLLAAVDPHSTQCPQIMPPKAWSIAPSLRTNGNKALLVVSQRTSPSMREWKEPDNIPAKSLMRYKAISAAHDISDILIGFLIDGYSSQLFHVTTTAEEREEIRQKCRDFIALVESGEEPDIDFGKDEAVIRKGATVTKTVFSQQQIIDLIEERENNNKIKAPLDAKIKQLDARNRQIDTFLIGAAGSSDTLNAGKHIVVISRDAKGSARLTFSKTTEDDLF